MPSLHETHKYSVPENSVRIACFPDKRIQDNRGLIVLHIYTKYEKYKSETLI